MSDAVLDLLQKQGLDYRASGKDYLIKCLNPDHEDSNPSFRIDRISGVAHCFSCGFKTNIFRHYGVFTNLAPAKIAALKEKLKAVRTMTEGVELPKGATPYVKVFRGISVNTLKQFEAFYTLDEEKLADRICFPIKDITNKTRAFIGRHVLSSAMPKYIIYPTGAELPVYPNKVLPGTTSIILVEGIFDMLNLFDKGATNAVCTFGANALQKNAKQKLLPFKAQGVTHVYCLFDGDEAGQEAAANLKPKLEELDFIVEIIEMEEGTDPGGMSKDDVERLIHYTNK